MISAGSQLDDLKATLASIEREMISASADAATFAQLSKRRSAVQLEMIRLEHLVKKEEVEDAERHKQALFDRRDDAAARGAELDVERDALEQELNADVGRR